MNHMGTVKIETKRLLLIQFEERDLVAASMYILLASEYYSFSKKL